LKYSAQTIEFLDVQISIEKDVLQTTIFRKPTACNSILHGNSGHPKALKWSIPYSQFLRARRICSNDDCFKTEIMTMTQRFLERGYPLKILKDAHLRVLNMSRE
ncbi:hypothetical protein NDU88_004677, partial [Pleurodeles waltl]